MITRTLYLDYETFLSQPGCQAPPIVCASIAVNDGPVRVLHANFDRQELEAVLWDAITDASTEIVAYNGAMAEWVWTLAHRPQWASALFEFGRQGRLIDPYLIEKLGRIARGDLRPVKSLAVSLQEHGISTDMDKSNPWRFRFGTLWNVPVAQWPKEAYDYSAGDIAVRDLLKAQRLKYRPEEYVDLAQQTRRAIALHLTSCQGFPVDLQASLALQRQTREQLEIDRETLLEVGLVKAEVKKGEVHYVQKKKPATERIVAAYSALGRDAPRNALTMNALIKAYKTVDLPVPSLTCKPGKKASAAEIEAAFDAGVPRELLLGAHSLDEEACEGSRDELLMAYSRYGQSNTLLGKADRMVRAGRAKKPIQAGYDPIKNTGRTSSRQGQDPGPGEGWSAYGMQIQNQQREGGTRECFVAPGYDRWLEEHPDWLLRWADGDRRAAPPNAIVSVDYDAAEMGTWAQCCKWIVGYSALADIINDPERCPHIEMGVALRKQERPGPTWRERYAWGYDLRKTDKKLLKEVRNLAKGPNFGLPGGMGAARLMDYCWSNYRVPITLEEATEACAMWRRVYPEAQLYLDHITWNVLKSKSKFDKEARGTITQFVSGRMRGRVGYCDAANGFFQGLAADMASLASWRLMEAAYEQTSSPLYGCRPLAFVHDEWLFSIPRDRLHEAAYAMRDIMVQAARETCPDVNISASPAAMYRWSKAAGDPYFLGPKGELSGADGGRLVPYEEVQYLLKAA